MKTLPVGILVCAICLSTHSALAKEPAAGEALLAKIEDKWGGVMTTIRGWNAESLRQFREGYREYPADVLEAALAARSFERMMDTLDAHAAVRSQQVMEKALSKAHSMAETLPGDAANAQLVEARQLVAKSLGDDARDLVFIPITPCTVWDTRFATNPDSAGIINNATTKKFYSHLDGAGGSYAAYGGNPSCPETSQNSIGPRPFAVMMTVYINDATGNGWLTLYRDGDADPSLATISVYYSAGPTRTQTVISKSSRGYGSGTYDIAATSRFANTHASASVTGYFVKVTDAGTVTSVGTGTGLTGGPITTSGTISADTSVLQARVTSSCSAGSSIRAIAANGTVTCQADNNSGGTVTSVGASAPLTSSGGNTPNISFASTTSGTVLAGTGGAPVFTGSPSISGNLEMVASTPVAGNVLKGGSRFLHNYGSFNVFLGLGSGNFAMTGIENVAVGVNALANNTTGQGNVATGGGALVSNTTGSFNVASGRTALPFNTSGSNNIAIGTNTLYANTSGSNSVAVGQSTMQNNTIGGNNTAVGSGAALNGTTSNDNTALGAGALVSNTIGNSNTALGAYALQVASGSFNIGIGTLGGGNLTTGIHNIAIGNPGEAGEGNTIRVGNNFVQNRAFIAGIRGITTGVANAIPVLIDSNGQLGTISSSRRVKGDIADMDAASSALLRLRPVTFHYKGDAGRNLQYGLIAEEVADVYPGLVAHTARGEIETVMYQFLPTMLLNEVQKQQRTIEAQAREAAEYRERLERLEKQLAELTRSMHR